MLKKPVSNFLFGFLLSCLIILHISCSLPEIPEDDFDSEILGEITVDLDASKPHVRITELPPHAEYRNRGSISDSPPGSILPHRGQYPGKKSR